LVEGANPAGTPAVRVIIAKPLGIERRHRVAASPQAVAVPGLHGRLVAVLVRVGIERLGPW
jgi:hypothetical protein